LAEAYLQAGAVDREITEILTGMTLNSEDPESIASLRNAYAAGGAKGFWRKRLELRLAQAKQTYVSPVVLARIYARLGENDNALQLLEKVIRSTRSLCTL